MQELASEAENHRTRVCTENIAATDNPINIVHDNVQNHITTMARKTRPSEALLEMTLISSSPVLLQGARDDQGHLYTVNYEHEVRASS